MSLEKWLEYGWLKREASSRDEIESLMSIVQRGLVDARVTAVSADLRFIAAFNAALTCATIALRASGFRTSMQSGHHLKTIESLEHTSGADGKLLQRFRTFSHKRNRSLYDVAGVISDQELEAMISLAAELHDQVVGWLRKRHPELLPQ